MIERKFVSQNLKEYEIKEYLVKNLSRAGLSEVRLVRTPLGEKILISASRPGLVVGRAGANIARLTREIKEKFKLENPQIELDEVQNPNLDAAIVAEGIAGALERFGPSRFKGIGHKAMTDVMGAGALGVEILISGKIPSSRAKTWRFYQGYLKKCGDIAVNQVKKAEVQAKHKTGIIGIKVRIMPADIVLPDKVSIKTLEERGIEEVKEERAAEKAAEKAETDKPKKKRLPTKGPRKKKEQKPQRAAPVQTNESSESVEPVESSPDTSTSEGDQ
jgi:small subunit ribosomal protein S3